MEGGVKAMGWRATVPDKAHAVLARFDERSVHYELRERLGAEAARRTITAPPRPSQCISQIKLPSSLLIH